MLLFKEDNFMQILEGEEVEVMKLYETISKDPRHQRVSLVDKGEIDRRQFGDWSRG